MSIVFDKLKEITRKGAAADNHSRAGLSTDPDIYTFKRLIFSPRGIALIFGTTIGFAILSYYSLVFLKSHLDEATSKAIIVQRPNNLADPAAMDPNDPAAMDPANALVEGEVPGQQDGAAAKKKIKAFKVPQYFMAQVQPDNSQPGTSEDPSAQAVPGIDDEGAPRPSFTFKEKKPAAIKSVYDKTRSVSAPLATFDHLKPAGAAENKGTALVSSQPAAAPATRFYGLQKSSARPAANRSAPDNTGRAEELRQSRNHMISAIKTKKVSRITSLSAEFENAIVKNDAQTADRIMKALLKEQQPHQPYVLKLMAYREIQKENYPQAKKWLNLVLQEKQDDFEAGINMAVIEIRQQQFDRAKKRLLKLKELYPMQSGVDDLLEQF